ncbi:hypothetical protein GOBAR_AA36048 [Gossypium barbadense]|uniref:Uncharacterized protein n=1 Tax=Gossypium barbadense TaxID=3634 RepID=A0A2P5W0P5_GOSBA|nr:hypothetical protein GOBAR_AA36048 [Gossypium barbadense]
MSTRSVRTKGMRAHETSGQGTQIDSFAYQVQTPKPIVKNVEGAPTIDESQHEPVNEAVSQAMLSDLIIQVAPLQERVFEALVEKSKICKERIGSRIVPPMARDIRVNVGEAKVHA